MVQLDHTSIACPLILQSAECNRTESHLLRLPAEIRAKVFEYVYEDAKVTITSWTTKVNKVEAPKIWVALPRVCRQTYFKTAILPYKVTKFCFKDAEDVRRWADKRLKVQRESIAMVSLDYSWVKYVHTFWRYWDYATQRLPGLQKLYVIIPRSSFEPLGIQTIEKEIAEYLMKWRDLKAGEILDPWTMCESLKAKFNISFVLYAMA